MVDSNLILRKMSDLSDLMIEICLDVANHIISDKGYRRPVGYSDHFEILKENKIVGADLASRMMKMAKFRNLIVHNYDKIDAEIIVGILRKNLRDFDSFKTAVAAVIIKNLQM